VIKLWNSKIFWFIIIFIVLYWYFAPVFGILLFRHEGAGLRIWSPHMLVLAFILAFTPFLTLRFFPTSWLTKIIIRTKKVFKIIFLSLVPFLLIFYSLWYLPDIAFKESASFKVALSYIKQDTTITNKIGPINDYYNYQTVMDFHGKTNYEMRLFGQKGKAVAKIQLTRTDKWTIDTVIYKIE
jgi:hypothetical protein